MTCPDWGKLAALPREDAPWREAVAHLDHCERCWPLALRIDPTLVFRRLPDPEIDASMVEEVRRGVAVLRRSGAVEPARFRLKSARWGIAATLFLAFSLALAPGGRHSLPATPEASTSLMAEAREGHDSLPTGHLIAGQSQALANTSVEAPLVEKIGERGARIYQIRGKGVAVVMIVDHHIDV